MTFRENIATDVTRKAEKAKAGPAWPSKRLGHDGLSAAPTAHEPRGPDGRTAIDWVRECRRREREDEARREREGR